MDCDNKHTTMSVVSRYGCLRVSRVSCASPKNPETDFILTAEQRVFLNVNNGLVGVVKVMYLQEKIL